MLLQVKKLKAQLEQKSQKNGTDSSSSPDGEIIENGSDPNIAELQSKCTYSMHVNHSAAVCCFNVSPTAHECLLLLNLFRRFQQANE